METKQSNDYGLFKTLQYNRKVISGHVSRLMEVLKGNPDGLKDRPILVNEKMEIIDGQHRFEAVKKLGYPVYYTVGEGLSHQDAQKFNALQRNWTPLDYAKSYSEAGNDNYTQYLEFRKRIGVTHVVTAMYLSGNMSIGEYPQVFRLGKFKVLDKSLSDLQGQQLVEVGEVVPDFWRRKEFGVAFFTLLKHPGYDQAHFLRRMEHHAARNLAHFESMQDYQRAFERIYNFKTPMDKQIKLF